MTDDQVSTMAVPATREEAIAALVEYDVQRWGSAEREASKRNHSRLTYGRALNALANIAFLNDKPNVALRKAAKQALTPEDRKALREGG